MKLLFFGDVFGRPGREALKKELPNLKTKYNPDIVIANVENIAHGSGITAKTLEELDAPGIIDGYTLGDHAWDTPEASTILENMKHIVRPANFSGDNPGSGHAVIEGGGYRVLIVNLLGYIFGINENGDSYLKHEIDNPFVALDDILKNYSMGADNENKDRIDAIFVDIHAEFTSEKRALGFYADGRVSAVVGTHTHVPSYDAQILEGGTAYLTDAGMTGPANSVIGLDKDSIVKQYATGEKQKTDVSNETKVEIGAVLVSVGKNGLAESVEQIRNIVDL
ncbi:MAG: TIGR00282 family metallophosphoesterase [Candidatus Spechtbacterales bacterium]